MTNQDQLNQLADAFAHWYRTRSG